MAMNMKGRNQAVRLFKAGTTIVVFPAEGASAAPKICLGDVSGKTHLGNACQRAADLFRGPERPAVWQHDHCACRQGADLGG